MSIIKKVVFSRNIYNDVYMPYYKCKKRYLNLVGGGGSGKSVFAAQKVLTRLIQEPDHRFLMIRKVGKTIRNSQYQLLKDLVNLYNLESLFRFKESDLSVHCEQTNGTIISTGIDDPEKLKSITGITGTWIEEATELTLRDLIQINLRLRGITKHYKQHILTYNPIDEYHWLNNKFFVKQDEDAEVLITTFLNNKFIDKEYKKELLKLKEEDETLWKIYGLGQWATASGLIYKNWSEIGYMPDNLDDAIYGIDFGFSSPTAVIKVGKLGDDIYLQERVYQTQLSNPELIKLLKDLDDLRENRYPIYADNEDATRINELKMAGLYVREVKKDVLAGLEYCRRFKMFVTSDSTNLKKELKSYKYKEDKKSGLTMEEPVKFQDHACDAFRYAMYSHGIKYWGRREFTTSSRANNRRERSRNSSIVDNF